MDRRALLAAPLALVAPRRAQAQSSLLRIAVAGQSNPLGQGALANALSWQKPGDRFDFAPTCVYPDGNRGVLNEPTHGGGHLYPVTATSFYGAGYLTTMVRHLLLGGVEQVELVACAKGGSAVGSWLYQASTLSTNYLFGAAKALCNIAGPINLVLWHQGETDSQYADASSWYESREAQLAGLFQQHLQAPMMTCLLQTCLETQYPYQGIVNAAKQANWASGATLQGPDLRDLTCAPESSNHLMTPAKWQIAGERWAQCILPWWL